MNKARVSLVIVLALCVAAVVASAQQPQQERQPRSSQRSQAPQMLDIQGIWNHNNLITEERATIINAVGGGAKIGDYTGFPLNDAGRQFADSWMAARIELPEHQCHPHPTLYSAWGPGNFRITNVYDELTDRIIGLRIDGTFGRADRIVWIDGRPHPPEWARHTWAGFSTGEWDGNMLTVTTTHLKEAWFNRNGLTASDTVTMREHFIKHDNYLTVVFVVNDPEHLDEPFIRTTQAVLDPTMQLAPAECQVFNTALISEHPRGYVPHWLPGKNEQIKEYAEKYGVPLDAARGVQKTIYPEYISEIKQWLKDRKPAATSSASLR